MRYTDRLNIPMDLYGFEINILYLFYLFIYYTNSVHILCGYKCKLRKLPGILLGDSNMKSLLVDMTNFKV